MSTPSTLTTRIACAGVCAGDARVRRSSSCSYRAGDAILFLVGSRARRDRTAPRVAVARRARDARGTRARVCRNARALDSRARARRSDARARRERCPRRTGPSKKKNRVSASRASSAPRRVWNGWLFARARDGRGAAGARSSVLVTRAPRAPSSAGNARGRRGGARARRRRRRGGASLSRASVASVPRKKSPLARPSVRPSVRHRVSRSPPPSSL